ncbi:MAG: C1 family peptidase [Bacteriovoracaceae bacterium]
MLKALVLILFSFSLAAKTLDPVTGDDSSIESQPEYMAILAKVKSFGTFTMKDLPTIKGEVKPKEKSKGELAVEEAKARNRAIIAEQNAADKKLAEAAERADLSKDSFNADLAKMKAEDKRIRDGWKKEVRDQLKIWQTQQKIFLGKIKVYKEATFPIPVKEEPKKIVETPIAPRDIPEVHIVHSAFKVPVRDQEGRATCAAFTGVRALEILLAQNDTKEDLSEEYFYWASKPDCQGEPCSKRGSWVTRGYDYSMNRPMPDIPTEKSCAYNTKIETDNETHVPLQNGCKQGVVKVGKYEQVKTLAEVIDRLKKNMPVIMSAKLTPNFYINEGLVTVEDPSKDVKMDNHAMGHAFLAVGIMELPENLHAKEGKFCLVINNSWGAGWGAGGYSCLTENWLMKYRLNSSFVAINSVSM